MKTLQWILGVIASMALIFVLLITSFEIAAYSDFHWYQKEYEKYDVLSELSMEMDDVMDVTHEMMDYLRGNRDDLVVYTTIQGVNHTDFFNDQDKVHMADVRNLFIGGLELRLIALTIMIVCMVILIFSKADMKHLLPRSYQIALCGVAIVTVAIGGYAAMDFDSFFTKFHEVFFANDLWIFDPRYDYMIRMLPEGLFSDMTFRIGMIFILSLLILLIVSVIYDKRNKKKMNTISEVRC